MVQEGGVPREIHFDDVDVEPVGSPDSVRPVVAARAPETSLSHEANTPWSLNRL